MPVGEFPESPVLSGAPGSLNPAGVAIESTAARPDRARGGQSQPLAAIEAISIGRRDSTGVGWLFRDVSFEVNAGDRLAVAGATGAGKTVLMRAIALLDPLHAGTIHWNGQTVCRDAVPAYRTHVIYIHQRPALFEGSVEENLRRPYRLRAHRGMSFDRERILEHLDRLGRSAEFLAKSSRELSGGEAQVVALLRAIQLHPCVLLLDEPTASLDTATARSIETFVDSWFSAGQGARAFVWVSHDPEQRGRVASRFYSMHGGRLSQDA
jgi:putative ABC transport system ATP-binding protein